ncbi:MAG: DUF1592 domain-containing protein [Verrucomicrobiota bacterium]|nr:DUF1592 domain-containing protein [Verrucomicrobiota bacterium]
MKSFNFENEIIPLLEEYCFDCHGEGAKKGGFKIDELIGLGAFKQNQKKWDRVWKNLNNRNMPPANVPQPDDPEISSILTWIEDASFKPDLADDDFENARLRRLNRTEYENTIQDIFGIEIDAESYFPADDTGYGFDTIAEVLTLSPLLMEKYLGMAEIVMQKVLGPIQEENQSVQFFAENIAGGRQYESLRVLPQRGSFQINHTSTIEGEYEVKVWASASRAGHEFAKMQAQVNGQEIQTFSIESEYPRKSMYRFRFQGEENQPNQISLSFTNDFYDPKNRNPKRRDRNLYVEKIEILIPQGLDLSFRKTRLRLLGESETQNIKDHHALFSFKKWLPRIYRIELTEKDFAKHEFFFRDMRAKGLSSIEAVRETFKAALISPRFIFREESKGFEKPDKIDEFALAHRLSYFLWSSVPDDTLWELAKNRELRKNLKKEFLRMLSDPKLNAFIENFSGQWLQLRDLKLTSPNPDQFPEFSDSVRVSMIRETEEFFKYLLMENLPVDTLLSANFSMVNQELAKFYGLPGNFTEEFQRVVFTGEDLAKRGGILTHGSILAITSNATRTSPVKRGKWVLENLLAAPPREPPPNVTELEEPITKGNRVLTLREQMAQHSKNPMCYSCHASMDNLGYAMENFNAIGKWRTEEDGVPLDVLGKLSSGEKFNGVQELQRFLKKHKKQAIVRCIIKKLLTYGLGRGLTYKDRALVDDILSNFSGKDVLLADLLFAVIESESFQNGY